MLLHRRGGAREANAHLATMMLAGESTWVLIRYGGPNLGTCQRLSLVERFEPRTRTVGVVILGD